MDPRCRIRMFGGLTVRQADREITRFKTQKCASLLAYLAYHLGRAHKREVLAELLWPERPPKAGRTNLSTALSSLRRQLEPPGVPAGAIIEGDRFAVQLNPEVVTTDVAEFQSALRAADSADGPTERGQLLGDAVGLYEGELLPGFYEDWVVIEQRKLADQYFDAVLALVGLLEEAGQVDESVDLLRLALTHDPLREEVHAELMRLLAVAGQPEAALRQYTEITAYLDEELGRAPSASVRQLAELIEAKGAGIRTPDLDKALEATPPAPEPPCPPAGTVTLLLTDIEGCTALWERLGEGFRPSLDVHHKLLRKEFAASGGTEVKEAGDAFIVSFRSAGHAVECAIACQRALAAHEWPEAVGRLRVRMALYTGDVSAEGGDYHDPALHRASRMLTSAHGGQTIATEATVTLLRQDPIPGVSFADLGIYRLRDVPGPQRLFQVNYPDMPQREFPPLRAEAGRAAKLPPQFTRFFGRQAQLQDLGQLLAGDDVRLVTLTGAGGCGKTRLALELAARLVEPFEGAVWFVPLADLSDPQLIPGAVTDALGLSRSQSPDALAPVVAELGRQPSLLVLDNMEQFAAEGGIIVHELLERVPELTCVVTSREHLNLPEEHEFVVPPLATPPEPASPEELVRYESVQLFVDRAQGARPDFQITAGNAEAVGTLCEHLDGLPLAIELAAARAQVLTPSQMVEQLHRRFEFLVSRRRVAEKRHKTLRAAIEWSYRLLSPAVQRFFAGLSVFRGGCTAEAAEAVCEEPNALDYLEQLIGSSLVLSEETPDGMRFGMLETLREFARDQLDPKALSELRDRHADYFLAQAEELEETRKRGQRLSLPSKREWVARFQRDDDNHRAALAWLSGREDGADRGLRLVTARAMFCFHTGRTREGRRQLAEQLDAPQTQGPTMARARALLSLAILSSQLGETEDTWTCAQEALATARELGTPEDIAECLSVAAFAAGCHGEHAYERAYRAESLEMFRDAGDEVHVAWALASQALTAQLHGETETARALNEDALERFRRLDHNWGIAKCLWDTGRAALRSGDHETARRDFDEALAVHRAADDQLGVAVALSDLANLALAENDHDEAKALLQEAAPMYEAARFFAGFAGALRVLGSVFVRTGEHAEAIAKQEQALAMYGRLGRPRMEACCLDDIGRTLVLAGDHEAALQPLRNSLAIYGRPGVQTTPIRAIEALASIAVHRDDHVRAATLLGVVDAKRGDREDLVEIGGPEDRNQDVAAVREALGEKAFNEAWDKGQAMTLEGAVAYALASAASEGDAS